LFPFREYIEGFWKLNVEVELESICPDHATVLWCVTDHFHLKMAEKIFNITAGMWLN